jgi:hypothetical protein
MIFTGRNPDLINFRLPDSQFSSERNSLITSKPSPFGRGLGEGSICLVRSCPHPASLPLIKLVLRMRIENWAIEN